MIDPGLPPLIVPSLHLVIGSTIPNAVLDIELVAGLSVGVWALLRLAGLVLLSAAVAGGTAIAYRWLAGTRVPTGVALILGVGGVALYLNTTALLGATVGGTADPFGLGTVIANIVTFVAAGVAAPIGGRVGDRIAADWLSFPTVSIDRDLGTIVRAGGRVITVDLPDDIADLPDYDPVSPETKDRMAGTRLVFPRGLTVAELEARLATRLRDDYQVGHVDVELTADGTVEHFAVGSRTAGLGPTLAPGTAAIAVRADPAFSAGPGDVVHLWRGPDHADRTRDGEDVPAPASGSATEASAPHVTATDTTPKRVAAAEIRAVADDVVTLAVDAAVAADLAGGTYRLLTLPVDTRDDRAFAGLLARSAETMGHVTIDPGSGLDGVAIGGLDATVVALCPEAGDIVPLPPRERTLAAGDGIYVVGRPDTIRKVEQAATV